MGRGLAVKVDRIDQHLGETEELLKALIFIAENTDCDQHELLQHAAVTLCWCAIDKLDIALGDLGQLQGE